MLLMQPGDIVLNCRIVRQLPVQGGMGLIYEGRMLDSARMVAVKTLRPEYSQRTDIRRRFLNEAWVLASLDHPSIVRLFEHGVTDEGDPFIIMEFLLGETLGQRLEREQRVPYDEGLFLLRQVASALRTAHQIGVVHRDLKPENLYLVPDAELQHGTRAKIIDFGIAKFLEDQRRSHLTQVGSVLGSFRYMSPEQCKGDGELDHRSDLYSLGCIAFQMFCGKLPFEATSNHEWHLAHCLEKPCLPSKHDPSFPPDLEALILQLLEKSPDDRPQSSEELYERICVLEKYLSAHGTTFVFAKPGAHSVTVTLAPVPIDDPILSGDSRRLPDRSTNSDALEPMVSESTLGGRTGNTPYNDEGLCSHGSSDDSSNEGVAAPRPTSIVPSFLARSALVTSGFAFLGLVVFTLANNCGFPRSEDTGVDANTPSLSDANLVDRDAGGLPHDAALDATVASAKKGEHTEGDRRPPRGTRRSDNNPPGTDAPEAGKDTTRTPGKSLDAGTPPSDAHHEVPVAFDRACSVEAQRAYREARAQEKDLRHEDASDLYWQAYRECNLSEYLDAFCRVTVRVGRATPKVLKGTRYDNCIERSH